MLLTPPITSRYSLKIPPRQLRFTPPQWPHFSLKWALRQKPCPTPSFTRACRPWVNERPSAPHGRPSSAVPYPHSCHRSLRVMWWETTTDPGRPTITQDHVCLGRERVVIFPYAVRRAATRQLRTLILLSTKFDKNEAGPSLAPASHSLWSPSHSPLMTTLPRAFPWPRWRVASGGSGVGRRPAHPPLRSAIRQW